MIPFDTATRLKWALLPAAVSTLLFFTLTTNSVALFCCVALAVPTWWLARAGVVEALCVRRGMSLDTVRSLCITLLAPGLNLLMLAFTLAWGMEFVRQPDAAQPPDDGTESAAAAARARAAQRAAERRSAPPAAKPENARVERGLDLRAPGKVFPSIKMVGIAPREGLTFHMEIQAPEGSLPPGARMTPGMQPVHWVSPDGFAVVFLVDAGAHYTWLSRDELAASGLSLDEVRDIALRNLSELVARKPLLGVKSGDVHYHVFALGGDHEAALVLLDDLWDKEMAEHTPNGAVVTFCARDICGFCDAADAASIAELRKTPIAMRANDTPTNRRITDTLYVRRAGRWHPLP